MKVSVQILKGNGNAERTCSAMITGLQRHAVQVDAATIKLPDHPLNLSSYDAVVLWGFVDSCQAVIRHCIKNGIPWVFMDMGYWNRGTHYKVSVNDRHPTGYFRKYTRPYDRAKNQIAALKPWNKSGEQVVVAGMGPKAAWSYGLLTDEWEHSVLRHLKTTTNRLLIYRPKNNSSISRTITGVLLDRSTPMDALFKRTHLVITHHSNFAVDALIAGVPVVSIKGVGSVMGHTNLRNIDDPKYPEDRAQFLADVGYCQWSLDEMSSGECWRQLVDDGLIVRGNPT